MSNSRTYDMILKAQIDQALQPLAQVVQRVKDLTTVLNEQRQAAKTADTTTAEYGKALRDLTSASNDLLKVRTTLSQFPQKQEAANAQQTAADTKRQARDEFAATLLGQQGPATDAQTGKLNRLNTAFEKAQERADKAAAAYQNEIEKLQRLGILTNDVADAQERLNAAHAEISTNVQTSTEALRAGQAQSDTLIATLRAAQIEKQVANQRAQDAAKFRADLEAEARAVIASAEAIRAKGRAAQEAADVGTARNRRQADIQAAFEEADAERALETQRAQASAKFIADQEREAKAVLDAAEAIRAKGRAALEAAQAGTVRNQRQYDIEAAFAADDAEKALATRRSQDARTFQSEQARLAQAVAAVWEAEDKAAQKAREALQAFQAEVQKAVSQGAAFQANAASQRGLIGAPVTLPAPTLAAQVRAALATPPGPGAGLDSLSSVQAAIEHVTSVVAPGSAALKDYNHELQTLNAVDKSIVAQSQIVDNFLKARKAAEDAARAFRDAERELAALQATPRTAENLSEVTSAIAAKNRQIGSVEGGTGLAAQARAAVEALAAEEKKLNDVGIAAHQANIAYHDLFTAAVDASTARQDLLTKQQAATAAQITEAERRAAAVSTAAAPTIATARGAVASVAGAGRTGVSDTLDTAEAVDKLDASFKKANLTAQAYNRVMDEVFAIQHRIAADASLIDSYTAQSAAVSKATSAFNDAQAELARVAAAARAGTASLAELNAAEARLNGAAAEVSKQATAQAALDAQLKTRKIDTAALVAETNKLVDVTNRLNAVQERATAAGGKNTIFGLSQYQAQNLTFQVNDVITQLSLGQGVLRTFESQAGQIFQIFETSISALQRIVLYGLPAAAAIGAVVLALLRVKETLDTQREFSRLLAASADGAAYSAKQLTALSRELETFGTSFTDATEAVKQFAQAGLSPAAIAQFGKTVQNVADVTGVKFTEALKQVGVIATGSVDDIQKLDKELNFLTTAQYAAIRAAAEAGHTDDARSIALNALTTSMQKGRDQGLAPFTEATRELSKAYHDLLDAFADTGVIVGLVKLLADLAKSAAEVTSALNKMFNPTKEDAELKVTSYSKALDAIKLKITEITNSGLPQDAKNSILQTLEAQARELTRQLELAKQARDKLTTPGAPGSTPLPGTSGLAPEARSASAVALTHLGENASQVAPFLKGQIDPIVNAWCAAFANAALKEAGLSGSGSNVATSFEKWGQSVAAGAVQAGDILVQARGHAAGETGGHVGIATGNFKTGPDGALLVEMVSGNHSGRVERSFERADELDARRATAAERLPTGGAAGAVVTDPVGVQRNVENTVRDAKTAVDVLEDIRKRAAAIVNETLRGSERVASDEARVAEFAKQRQREVGAQFTGPIPTEVTSALNDEIEKFRKKLADERELQIKEANNAATQLVKSAEVQVDRADKANPDAARRVVDTQFEAALQALNLQIAKGATDALGASAIAARDKLLQLRDRARDEAAAAADRIVVDDSVKARDELIGQVQSDLNKGTLSLSDAFKKIAAIIQQFKPQIDQAIASSNKDLASLPQTPATQAQIAKNQAVDTSGREATKALDETGLAKVNALIAARDIKVKELNDDVANGRKTQAEADNEIVHAYQRAKGPLDDLIDSLQKQLDLQKQIGEISPEVYEKMTAALQKAKAATDDLTATQRRFVQEVENSITSRAVQGIDDIGSAIGKGIAKTETWQEAIRDVGLAFANFTAGVLQDVANMIAKQLILNTLQSAFKGTGAGNFLASLAGGGAAASGFAASTGSSVASVAETALTSGVYHGGGIVGAAGAVWRRVDPALFIGAPRMHNGGMVGLASNERAAILEDGEEVLKRGNWRHAGNNPKQDGRPDSAQSIRNVLVFKDEDVAGAMSGSEGERVVLTHLKRNQTAVRQLLGGR